MKKYINDEKNGLDYTLVNGVYLPNLISTETHYEIGIWGQRHLDYIKHHRKVFYINLKTNCKLNSYLHEVDIRATEMYDRLVKHSNWHDGLGAGNEQHHKSGQRNSESIRYLYVMKTGLLLKQLCLFDMV